MRVRHVAIGSSCAAALVAVACSDASGTGEFAGVLHVVNGSASSVDVFVDGAKQASSLAPGAISSRIVVPMSTTRVELRPAGASSGATVTADPRPSAGVTFVAALGTSGSAVSAVALPDTGAVPSAGKAKLQAIHLAAKAPAIWVWRKQPDFPTPVTFQFPHPYGEATPYIESLPGTWEVYVTPAGGNPAVNALAHLTLTIAANQAKRVVVLDSANTVRIVELTP